MIPDALDALVIDHPNATAAQILALCRLDTRVASAEMGGVFVLKDATLANVAASMTRTAPVITRINRRAALASLENLNLLRYLANVQKIANLAGNANTPPATLSDLDAQGS